MVIKNPQYKSLAIKSLCHALLNDPDCNVRCSAAKALGQIGDEEAVPSLVEAVSKERKDFVRQKVVESLGKIGNCDYLNELISTSSNINIHNIYNPNGTFQNGTFGIGYNSGEIEGNAKVAGIDNEAQQQDIT